ncbi:MAG: AAA family ATPase [Deltaproteobacteria bacterium]|nr:MAG: AAA family ATPase [Deltaproteobacteria bacterium]
MALHLKSISFLNEKYPETENYPFNLPIFHQTRRLTFDTPVTFFIGENGSGKSTLLEALSHACGIHIWRAAGNTRCRHNPFEDLFYKYLRPAWSAGPVPGSFFGSDIFKDFTCFLDDWATTDPGYLKYFGGKSLVTQSHGQSMMSFFRNRYQVKGLYLMDEPETALSPRSQLELLDVLNTNSQAGHAQFIIVTHSPILMAFDGATIYNFDRSPIRPIAYEQTEHYQIYKNFLLDRKNHQK